MPPKKRLLFVSHEMTLSGAPIQLAYLIRWLNERGWSTTLVAPEAGPIAAMLPGIEIKYDTQLLIDPYYTELRRLASQFDAVVANTIATWQAVQAAHLENIPVLWYIHETQVGRQLMEVVHMIEPTLALADAIVIPTEMTRNIYAASRQELIDLIPYGIPEVTAEPHVPTDSLGVAVIGTFEPRKGQDILLEAVRRLDPAQRTRATIRLAGRALEKSFYDSLQKQCQEFKNVELLGPLDHAAAMKFLSWADVLVCPSRDETMPIVLLEAMSLGKGIVATRVGGIEEWIVDGHNGLLVPSEDAPALAHALSRLVLDRDLLRNLGREARATFERCFTLERYGEQFAAVLRRIIARGAPDSA